MRVLSIILLCSCSVPSIKPPEEKQREDKLKQELRKKAEIKHKEEQEYKKIYKIMGVCEKKGFDNICQPNAQKRHSSHRVVSVNIQHCQGERGYRLFYPVIQGFGGFIGEQVVNSGAFVGPEAVVCGKAILEKGAMILDHAVLRGKVYVGGKSRIFGKAQVDGRVHVSKGTKIFDEAMIRGKHRFEAAAIFHSSKWVSSEKESFLESGSLSENVEIMRALKVKNLHLAQRNKIPRSDQEKENKWRAFRWVAEGHSVKLFESFKKNPQNLTVRLDDGKNLLHWIVLHPSLPDREKLIKSLLLLGVNIDQQDQWGNTPLHLAAQRSDFQMGSFLISEGAIVDRQNKNLRTVLHEFLYHLSAREDERFAIEASEFVRKLLVQKNLVNRIDTAGRTPLMIIASTAYVRLAKRFLVHGADLYTRDKNGLAAIHYARLSKQKEMQEFFEQWLDENQDLFH